MAKGMTKTQLIRFMAEKMELNNKQSAAFFTMLADTAVKETKKNGEFAIPGIGKLVKAERKAPIGRNPQTGEPSPRPRSSLGSTRAPSLSGFTRAGPLTAMQVYEGVCLLPWLLASISGTGNLVACPPLSGIGPS